MYQLSSLVSDTIGLAADAVVMRGRRTIERFDADPVFERQRQRKAGREVRLFAAAAQSGGKQSGIQHLFHGIGSFHRLPRRLDIAAQEHQRARRHFGHADGVVRDVERVADVRLPCRVFLGLEGVHADHVPILETGVGGEDRNAFARIFVRKRMVGLADGVRLARNAVRESCTTVECRGSLTIGTSPTPTYWFQ